MPRVTRKLGLGADGSYVDLTPRDGPAHAAVRLLEVLVNSCSVYFESPNSGKNFVLVKGRDNSFPEQRVVLTEYSRQMLERQHKGMAKPTLQPMLYPPRSWREDPEGEGYIGGYYHLDDKRLISARKYRKHTRALEHPVGTETLSAINAVQATRWRINPSVARALHLVAESQYRDRLDLGPSEKVPPAQRRTLAERQAMSSRDRSEYHRNRRDIAKKNSRREITGRLLIAIDEDKERDCIWFPHFLDYRGRMYPYPHDLHPQASDRVRACLEFAEAKPLGSDGEEWLKRQLPASYDSEAPNQPNWVEEQEDHIIGLAKDPLEEIEFWEKAKAPWRFLAVCCEWARLRDYHDLHGDSSGFLSRLPVTMDGRCNGLQHLAALAGDPKLGELVHITPTDGDASRDVYQVIADELEDIVKRDAIEGDDQKKHAASAWLRGDNLISRDTVKPAVMTFPFGAKERGFIRQILEGDAVYEIPDGDSWNNARYLAAAIMEITSKRAGGVLSEAKAVMDWLSEVAKDLARENIPMTWANPAGMNVRLANFRIKSKWIDLHGLFKRVRIKYRQEDTEKLSTLKQSQGITACLVHSFDAAHLAKTVNACVGEGIDSFAVIHDSYGTRACHATTMARVLREQFVEIHSQPWLQMLAERWRRQVVNLPGVEVSDPPELGDLDIRSVVHSPTFFG